MQPSKEFGLLYITVVKYFFHLLFMLLCEKYEKGTITVKLALVIKVDRSVCSASVYTKKNIEKVSVPKKLSVISFILRFFYLFVFF